MIFRNNNKKQAYWIGAHELRRHTADEKEEEDVDGGGEEGGGGESTKPKTHFSYSNENASINHFVMCELLSKNCL